MVREPNVPLFLWIATAVLTHILFAGGADQASKFVQARLDLHRFAAAVQSHVRGAGQPVEVALLSEDEALPPAESIAPEPENSEPEEADSLEQPEPERLAQAEPPVQPEDPAERPPEPAQHKREAKEKKRQLEEPEKPPVQILELKRERRIAVRQHVRDKNQPDNPNAEFIGDEANWVKEQTQARITSTDQNDPNPTPGGHHLGPTDDPGNADETRVGQSDDAPGDPDRTPTPLGPPEQSEVASVDQRLQAQPRRGAPRPAEPPRTLPRRPGQQARAAKPAIEGSPEKIASEHGSFTIAGKRAAQSAQRARRARKRRLPPPRRRADDLLGLGAAGVTENGVNLNLTPQTAIAAIGRDQLTRERHADGERRRSKHRGSWRNPGIERWRAAIENYVAHVKPGNQTALNTARVPFASYLNAVHNRIHPVFADTFLVSLDSLPATHPMNQMDISTNLEIVLSPADGRLVDVGVTKTSGVTAFDIGALESVFRASPFGPPPREIISPDGNVYFHWEFHRNPYYACSTYFARPYILKTKPRSVPPKLGPPRRNPLRPREGPPPAPRRHGHAIPESAPKHAADRPFRPAPRKAFSSG